jgi:molecular chaperone DnaK (HSP70)
VIDDTSAASFGHYCLNNVKDPMVHLVIDIGGSMAKFGKTSTEDGIVEVFSKNGNYILAGSQFDKRIYNHCIEVFNQ